MESVYLMQTATGIGVRETRRILGEYVVTEQDAIKCKRFGDVIAISSNPMPSYHGKRFFFNHEGFEIPYRSLVPKKVEGLFSPPARWRPRWLLGTLRVVQQQWRPREMSRRESSTSRRCRNCCSARTLNCVCSARDNLFQHLLASPECFFVSTLL